MMAMRGIKSSRDFGLIVD